MLIFKTSAQLKLANLRVDDVVRLLENVSDDKRERILIVQDAATFGDTPDEVNDFELANNNVAVTLTGQVRYEPQSSNDSGKAVARVDNRSNPAAVAVGQGNRGLLDLSPRITRLVDGRFDFWFEGTNQTTSGYGSDTMWLNSNGGSTKVHTQETLAPGVDIPQVPTALFYSRTVVTSVPGANNFVRKSQRLEDARTYAGQNIVVSFWARADAVKNIALSFDQIFEGSGLLDVRGIGDQKVELDTTFKRFELQFAISSVAGKTINDNSYLSLNIWFDAGSNFDSQTDTLGQQSGTFDLACVQIDVGTTAKPFYEFDPKEALDRVYRNFFRIDKSDLFYVYGNGRQFDTDTGLITIEFPIPMRDDPVFTSSDPVTTLTIGEGGFGRTISSITLPSGRNSNIKATLIVDVSINFSGTTSAITLEANGTLGAFIQFDARL